MIYLIDDKENMLLKMGSEKIGEILNRVAEYYEKDRILISMDPFTYGFAIRPNAEEKICNEFNLTDENLKELMNDIMFFIRALVMDREDNIFERYGKTKKIIEIVEIFKKKLQRRIIEILRFKLSCKTQYFEDLSWDISIRVKQNGGIKARIPFSMIKMTFSKPGLSLQQFLGEENTMTFECTLRDVEEMIESLEEIKEALKELEGKEE